MRDFTKYVFSCKSQFARPSRNFFKAIQNSSRKPGVLSKENEELLNDEHNQKEFPWASSDKHFLLRF